MKQKIITKTIWLISLVSLCTDMASEMLYPVMPFFLSSIGFSALYIGLLEGIAEAVAGLSKPYFGHWSDSIQKRVPFVRTGYTLSALSKPMMALLFHPLWIFFARAVDRIGKGMRTGARDAMLNDEAGKENKARVFGFHRSMDTAGAVLGPLMALLFLYFFPNQYKPFFLLAFIPGAAAIVLTYILKDKKYTTDVITANKRPGVFAFTKYWKTSPAPYKKLLTGLILFAAFNSSDIFLLLKLKENGVSAAAAVTIYIFYNAVYALLAYPVGILADKLGMKKIFLAGLIAFAGVYAGFAFANDMLVYLLLFILYGFYAAATEGVAKAWICTIVKPEEAATAVGTYTGFQSIAALFASFICGLIWSEVSPFAAFSITAAVAILVIVYLGRIFSTGLPVQKK